MDYLHSLIIGIASGLVASVPLGPIGVLCIQRTLSNNRFSGMISGFGAATADTLFAILAIFSLSYINSFIDKYNFWVEIIGGIIVVAFGLSIYFKKVSDPASQGGGNKSKMDYVSNYLSVLLLTLPNPAYFFVFVWVFAALGVGGPEQVSHWHDIAVIFGVLVGACGWWFVLTFAVNKLRRKFNMRGLWWLNKISGGLIFLLGAWAIIGVMISLIPHLDF